MAGGQRARVLPRPGYPDYTRKPAIPGSRVYPGPGYTWIQSIPGTRVHPELGCTRVPGYTRDWGIHRRVTASRYAYPLVPLGTLWPGGLRQPLGGPCWEPPGGTPGASSWPPGGYREAPARRACLGCVRQEEVAGRPPYLCAICLKKLHLVLGFQPLDLQWRANSMIFSDS